MTKHFILLILFIAIRSTMYSCSCMKEASIKQSIEESDLVIKGQVLTFEIIDYAENGFERIIPQDSVKFILATDMNKGLVMARYKVIILNAFKGVTTSDTIEIITGLGGGDCGVIFSPKEDYLIYAKIQDNPYKPVGDDIYSTNICTRTKAYNSLEEKKIERICKRKKVCL